ncbi:MAG: MJ0042-type zinc finger domain-containing protein [Pseudomonadota bacterium]
MIVTCPACATRYSMDPASLGPEGRRVRCAKCKHTWHQAPPDDMPRRVDLAPPDPALDMSLAMRGPADAGAPGVAVQPDSVAIPPRPRPVQPRGGGISTGLGSLVLLLALLGLAAGAAYLWRQSVVAQWPQARDLYASVGIEVPILGEGLELSNVTFVRQTIDGEPVLVVHGEIFNKTQTKQPLPNLLATLRTEKNQWLFDWVFKIDKAELEPGETTTFTTTAKNPPEDSRRLSVTFTSKPIGG